MNPSNSVPELVATAQSEAKPYIESIAASDSKDIDAATLALERAAVDVYTMFEAKMQHHFRRGPFSKKLKALLLEAGQPDLAERMQDYYLAVNVLKHGKGASHRELLARPSDLFDLKPTDAPEGPEGPASLIDVTGAGFFDGLTATLLEAHAFLDARSS